MLHVVDNLHEFVARVALVLAVPVAQHVERWHGLLSSNLDKVAQCLLVLMAIAHEVPVDGILVNGLCQPVDAVYLLVEGEGRRAIATLGTWRLINDAPTGS